MSTRVYLLRHAESADPTVFHGAESDVGLSPRGQRQAQAIATELASLKPAVVISSAMVRAVQTATPIAQAAGVPLQIEPQLHERRVGALSGQPFPAASGIWPETRQRWIDGDTGYAPTGAESFDDLRHRLLPVWNAVTRQHHGRTLVVVAHGIVCRVLLLCLLPGKGPSAWNDFGPMLNVAINELHWTGQTWQALQINHVPESVAAL